jgi:PAS domain S-box-containing protein
VAGLFLSIMLALITGFALRSRQKSALLLEKENLLSLFFKHTPAAVAMFDKEMRYMAASDRWYNDYNLKGQHIIGKSHYEVFPEIEVNHPHWVETHKRSLAGEVIKEEEEVFLRDDGRSDWIRYELHPWYKKKVHWAALLCLPKLLQSANKWIK